MNRDYSEMTALMANDEHVKLLKQGVAAWNARRAVNRWDNFAEPNLSEAKFGGAGRVSLLILSSCAILAFSL